MSDVLQKACFLVFLISCQGVEEGNQHDMTKERSDRSALTEIDLRCDCAELFPNGELYGYDGHGSVTQRSSLECSYVYGDLEQDQASAPVLSVKISRIEGGKPLREESDVYFGEFSQINERGEHRVDNVGQALSARGTLPSSDYARYSVSYDRENSLRLKTKETAESTAATQMFKSTIPPFLSDLWNRIPQACEK